jgi:hypothetical protein
VCRTFFAVCFFILINCLNGFLSYIRYFTSTEFITVFSIVSVISMVIYFAAEVQEISLVGNVVKLREVKKEAEQAIENLQASSISTFAFLLDISKNFSGGFASNITPKDERLDNFYFLYENIKKAGVEKELKDRIISCADLFMEGQKYIIRNYSNADISCKETPDELTNVALKTDALRITNTLPEDKVRSNIIEAINHYRNLYTIKHKLLS